MIEHRFRCLKCRLPWVLFAKPPVIPICPYCGGKGGAL